VSIKGSCHCGRIAFEAEGEPDQAMECNCSHCARKGFLLWFTTPDKFTVTGDESAMTLYLFNKHNIQHRFCTVCGVEPFARGVGPGGKAMVAVNLRCAPDLDLSGVKIVPVDRKSF
jgi:hypothetical protein